MDERIKTVGTETCNCERNRRPGHEDEVWLVCPDCVERLLAEADKAARRPFCEMERLGVGRCGPDGVVHCNCAPAHEADCPNREDRELAEADAEEHNAEEHGGDDGQG